MDVANRSDGLLETTLDWWELAGVDVLVDDAPRNWLAPAPAPTPIPPPKPYPSESWGPENQITDPRTVDKFTTLEQLTTYLSDPQTLCELGPHRLPATGSTASGAMLLVDMPDAPDAAAGHLLSGDIGRLFDRMLGAIGRDRQSIYLASIVPARPPGGILDSQLEKTLFRLAADHVALIAPKVVLLMGDATTRALIGTGLAEARGISHQVNHNGIEFMAIATFHPRFLLKHPACKADAWADLRLFLETSES